MFLPFMRFMLICSCCCISFHSVSFFQFCCVYFVGLCLFFFGVFIKIIKLNLLSFEWDEFKSAIRLCNNTSEQMTVQWTNRTNRTKRKWTVEWSVCARAKRREKHRKIQICTVSMWLRMRVQINIKNEIQKISECKTEIERERSIEQRRRHWRKTWTRNNCELCVNAS